MTPKLIYKIITTVGEETENCNAAFKQLEQLVNKHIVLSIENYTFNRIFNHKFMIYNDKYQFSLSYV